MTEIEFNADMGEGYGVWATPAMLWRCGLEDSGALQPPADPGVPDVRAVMRRVSTVNLACGFHAGDPLLIKHYVAAARQAGCSVGAHPSYPDREGFGLRAMDLTRQELVAAIHYQMAALEGLLRLEGMDLHHVKFHGALYNRAAQDRATAEHAVEAVATYRRGLPVYGLPSSCIEDAALRAGVPFVREGFADRAYHRDGRLVDRRRPDAMVLGPAAVGARVARMVAEGVVRSIEGEDVSLSPGTICFHADTPGAVGFLDGATRLLDAARVSVAGR